LEDLPTQLFFLNKSLESCPAITLFLFPRAKFEFWRERWVRSVKFREEFWEVDLERGRMRRLGEEAGARAFDGDGDVEAGSEDRVGDNTKVEILLSNAELK
jgi:hypothetical protein